MEIYHCRTKILKPDESIGAEDLLSLLRQMNVTGMA